MDPRNIRVSILDLVVSTPDAGGYLAVNDDYNLQLQSNDIGLPTAVDSGATCDFFELEKYVWFSSKTDCHMTVTNVAADTALNLSLRD